MSSSLRDDERSMPVQTLDDVRPRMAKAVQRGPTIGAVVKDALSQHYGSLKAAAITMHKDQSQLTRELEGNKLAGLEQCDGEAKACIAKALYEQFGNDDPKAQIRRALRAAKQALTEVEEWMARG